jgi:hypothetical protein
MDFYLAYTIRIIKEKKEASDEKQGTAGSGIPPNGESH